MHRVVVLPTHTPYIIAVSQSLETVTAELALLRHIFAVAVPLALLLAGIGGWLLARKSLAPVVAMADSAQRISVENLAQRLPIAHPRDELGHLAATFNALLARLEASFMQQRQFMADASHELRTPLAVMHTTADVTLQQPSRDGKRVSRGARDYWPADAAPDAPGRWRCARSPMRMPDTGRCICRRSIWMNC